MTFEFRPPVRENVPLLLGVAGGTGSGKTYSALRMARGISHGEPFAAIDTENGRMLHYADEFPEMRHGRLNPPFKPDLYAQVIAAADAQGFPVIVVDSASHEWAGDGGVLDMQLAEYQRLGGTDNVKLLSWSQPKQEHKRLVQGLLQVKAHAILCFRAEPKVDMIRKNNKTEVVPKASLIGLEGWIPITEKMLPYELTASFLLMADAPGIPKPIKLQEQHRPFVPLNEPLSEETGRLFAEWSAGGKRADLRAELTELLRELGREEYLTGITDKQWHNPSWVARQIAAAKTKLSERDASRSPEETASPPSRSEFTIPESVQ